MNPSVSKLLLAGLLVVGPIPLVLARPPEDRPPSVAEENWIAVSESAGIILIPGKVDSLPPPPPPGPSGQAENHEQVSPTQPSALYGVLMARYHGVWTRIAWPSPSGQVSPL